MSQVRYKYERLAKYPHMLARDVVLWERFLAKFPNQYQEVSYDVKVGRGVELPASYPGNMVTDALALTRKRIDVVGYKQGGVDVIEVKPMAGLSAIGQVISYKILYEIQFAESGPVQAVILTDNKDVDYDVLCKALDIKIILV